MLIESDLGKMQSPFPTDNYTLSTKSKVVLDSGIAFPLRLHLKIITGVFIETIGRSFPPTSVMKYICFVKGKCKISLSNYS